MVTRLLRFQHSTAASSSYVVRIPNANVYRFGDPDGTRPALQAVDWTVREGESWAVVGSGAGGKRALLEVSERELYTRHIFAQPFLGPFLSPERANHLRIMRRPFSGTCGYRPLHPVDLCHR